MAKICVFDGVGKPFRSMKIELNDKIDYNHILVKNSVATICGSDLHTWRGLRPSHAPLVLGHEGMGKIIRIGDGDRKNKYSIGDRVTWSIFDRCYTCKPCTTFNLPQKCDKLFKYGHTSLAKGTGLDGCYSSHTLLRPGTHIAKIPDNISDSLAAPLNCAFSTIHAALDPQKLPKNSESALVQGAGLLGIYSCLVLKHKFNVSKVYVTDKNPERLHLAEKFGAIPLEPIEMDGPFIKSFDNSIIKKQTTHGIDISVETCGDSNVVKEGINLLRFGGHYVMVGMVHPHSQLSSVTGYDIIQKCASIHSIHNYGPVHLDEAINFLSSVVKKYPFEELISDPIPLEEMDRAFELAASQKWLRVSVDLE